MAQHNVDLIRAGYEHLLATGELPAHIMAPDFVWDMSHFIGWPEQQTYEGLDGSNAFMRNWTGSWDDWRLEVEELHGVGDQVLVIVNQSGRSKTTGMPLEMRFAQVFKLRDGIQVRMDMYSDVDEARRAVGVPAED